MLLCTVAIIGLVVVWVATARGPSGGKGLVGAVLVAGTIHLVVVLQREVSLSAAVPKGLVNNSILFSLGFPQSRISVKSMVFIQLFLTESWDLHA